MYVSCNPNARSGSYLYMTTLDEETFLLEHGWLYGSPAWSVEKASHPIYRDDEIPEVLYPDLSELPDLPENPDQSQNRPMSRSASTWIGLKMIRMVPMSSMLNPESTIKPAAGIFFTGKMKAGKALRFLKTSSKRYSRTYVPS